MITGLFVAAYGAKFLVDGGSAIAKRYNIPSIVIGSTIVAFGSSMPELTVNVNSALNRNTDLALGNILGSNLFNIAAIVGIVGMVVGNVPGSNIINIFFTLGATSSIVPIPLDLGLNTVVFVNIAVTALIVTVLLMKKNNTLCRGMGALLLFIYVGDLANAIMA